MAERKVMLNRLYPLGVFVWSYRYLWGCVLLTGVATNMYFSLEKLYQQWRLRHFFATLKKFGETTEWYLEDDLLIIQVSDGASEEVIFHKRLKEEELERLYEIGVMRKKRFVIPEYAQFFHYGK